ncbi:FGGY family carbohydrate kinase [Paenibacillus sp. JX-17]|uniref:FGGY family carbohydrate kinase n=1 Tax=Paenibacillus lacisoli TaxID=3064525 RepID=A0ABT9C8I2_9BACL|nr:FGGY family carbohydrate kinase [Paenibacillus sp. JX-17]MDO7905571.1 FGGY family carbohydrate kinase [Paenibacillus sp. JX-17]
MFVMGMDIGTTSISGIILDTDQQIIQCSRSLPNNSAIPSSTSGEKLQDPEVIWQLVSRLQAEMTATLAQPLGGIGLTGQMHGILYVDASGRHCSPLYTWQDQRAAEISAGGISFAETLSRRLRTPVAPGYGLATHACNVAQGLVPQEGVGMVTIADYIAMRMTRSAMPVIDPTQAAGVGGYDWRKGAFEQDKLEDAGLDISLLPQILPSGSQVGETPEGVAVFLSIGDNQASFLGSVSAPAESLLLNLGTGGQLSVYVDGYEGDIQGMERRPYPGGGYLWVGASLTGGKAYAVLEQFMRELIHTYTGRDPGSVYDYMESLTAQSAFSPQGSESLRVAAQFLGTRDNPTQRGAITNITMDNLTPANLTHGFIWGMVEELYHFAAALPPEVMQGRTRLIGSGNGLRLNQALRLAAEQQFGLPLQLPKWQEEGAVGAALTAAVGLGIVEHFVQAGRLLES